MTAQHLAASPTPPTKTERAHWAALARVPGFGPLRIAALVEHAGGAQAAWCAPTPAAKRAARLGPVLSARFAAARAALDPLALLAADEARGLRVVARSDDDYPADMRELRDPPAALWVRGRWPIPVKAIAIVGARAATAYGLRLARELARDLAAADVVVVSGAAAGIDRAAHEGALAASEGWTVAVLGCGLDHVYPRGHAGLYATLAARGTLVSEFPPDVAPASEHFPRRNRLIAALGKGLVVVEARERSGSLITVGHALDLGREVFAMPGPAGAASSAGTHQLLREGSRWCEGARDVLEAYGWGASAARTWAVEATGLAGVALDAIGGADASLDELIAATGLDAGRASALMLRLELGGLVRLGPGGRYGRA